VPGPVSLIECCNHLLVLSTMTVLKALPFKHPLPSEYHTWHQTCLPLEESYFVFVLGCAHASSSSLDVWHCVHTCALGAGSDLEPDTPTVLWSVTYQAPPPPTHTHLQCSKHLPCCGAASLQGMFVSHPATATRCHHPCCHKPNIKHFRVLNKLVPTSLH
jgi:hypothetical protein